MMFVCMPFYFEDVLGMSRGMTGLLMTPWPLTVAVVAPISGRLSDRFLGRPRRCGRPGGCRSSACSHSPSCRPHPRFWDIAWRMSLAGFGFGLFNSPNNRTIITSAPAARSGGASGMQATSRLMGQTIGTAIVGLLFGLVAADATHVALLLAPRSAQSPALPACFGRRQGKSLRRQRAGRPFDPSTFHAAGALTLKHEIALACAAGNRHRETNRNAVRLRDPIGFAGPP